MNQPLHEIELDATFAELYQLFGKPELDIIDGSSNFKLIWKIDNETTKSFVEMRNNVVGDVNKIEYVKIKSKDSSHLKHVASNINSIMIMNAEKRIKQLKQFK